MNVVSGGGSCSLGLTSMLRKLWVSQDLLAELQAVSVLLVLITSLQQQRKQIGHVTSEVGGLASSTSVQILSQTCEVHRTAGLTSAPHVTHTHILIPWESSKCRIAALENMDSARAWVMKGCWCNVIQTSGQMETERTTGYPHSPANCPANCPIHRVNSGKGWIIL